MERPAPLDEGRRDAGFDRRPTCWRAAVPRLLCRLATLAFTVLGCDLAVAQGTTAETGAPPRVKVGDASGRTLVARLHGPAESGVLLLPDGQIKRTNQLVYTDEPFVPDTADQIGDALRNGPFSKFSIKKTEHYLIVYQCSPAFAESSAKLLESLYKGLFDRFSKMGFCVHQSEFPLVAIIYANESDFRSRREVDLDIQAYYEINTNHIIFFETNERQLEDPMFAAMRKPQTVAHEGTHQVLHNIGIQPRLAQWPPWIVEGLAELASAAITKKGEWGGFGKANPLHVATIEDLEESLSGHGPSGERVRVGTAWDRSMVEYIITRERLTPTDYSLAWTLTHFLANKREADFIAYLKELGCRVPTQKRVPATDLSQFREHFGDDFPALDLQLNKHITKLRNAAPLTYFAVLFEQALPGNMVRKGTLVSRSPQVIREWVEERMPDRRGGAYHWEAVPFRTRQQALFYSDQWLGLAP